MEPMHDILRREQHRPGNGRHSTESRMFPGHEDRMTFHMMRIRNHPCPCGSGVRFVDCCLGKCRCKKCGRTYLSPEDGLEDCPLCGSARTIAMPLREVCG